MSHGWHESGRGAPPPGRSSLARLKALWTEVVVGEADPAAAGQACAYAHKLIARFPAATAYYVNECTHCFDEAEVAFDLLAHASHFITNVQEGVLVGRAHAHALSDVDWEQGGMRALETLATRLTLEKYRRTKSTRLATNC